MTPPAAAGRSNPGKLFSLSSLHLNNDVRAKIIKLIDDQTGLECGVL